MNDYFILSIRELPWI